MQVVVISILIVSTLAAALAALLVAAERYIVRYGPCEVDVNGEKQLAVTGGGTLLAALTEEKVFIPSACGGRGTCAYCKVKVLAGGGPVAPTEGPLLTPQELADGVRLSCQVKIRQDIRIEVPPELLSVKEYQAVLEEVKDLTYDIKRFRLRLTDPPEIDFIAGQYVQVLAPRYRGSSEEVYRAYSIASDPAEKNAVDLIIRKVPNGICTTYCFEHLEVGDPVTFTGPYGEFRLSEADSDIILIAGGSGMAPIECLLHHMRNTGSRRRATYFFGGNTVADMFMAEDMARFEAELHSFHYTPVVADVGKGDNWQGERGLVTEAVDRGVDHTETAEAYLCGSPAMIDAAIEVLKAKGFTRERTFFDKFS